MIYNETMLRLYSPNQKHCEKQVIIITVEPLPV